MSPTRGQVDLPTRLSRTTRRDASGCLLWTGSINGEGYGQFRLGSKAHLAHRAVYEAARGAIPEGLVIDHLCRNRACVEITHLEPVTRRENTLRSPVAPAALNAAKTHCPQGHEYTPENTYLYSSQSGRQCRTCARDRYHARKAG